MKSVFVGVVKQIYLTNPRENLNVFFQESMRSLSFQCFSVTFHDPEPALAHAKSVKTTS